MDVTTFIEVDEDLVRRAMQLTGEKTQSAAVQRALHELVDRSNCRREGMKDLEGIGWGVDIADEETRRQRREATLGLEGVGWEGDLDEMRRDRDFD